MEDIKIIELFEARSEKALSETSSKYGCYLLKVCMNILGTKQDSEECINDTYHIAWNNIPPDRPKSFLAYLGRITKNIALNRYDYLTADKRNTHFNTALCELDDVLVSSTDVMNVVGEKELSASISEFLRGTDERSRNIFIRRYWYNDSISDISKMFGVSVGNTKVILHRVRISLRSYLEKEGYVI